MNKLEYKNSGGFPLTTNRLDDIQETFALPINGLAAMAGNLAIISGCVEVGNTVTNGFIFVGNEIFEFRAGIKQTYITLFEDKVEKGFENGQQKIVNTKRYFTFGTGATNYKWTDFKRVPFLNELPSKMDQKSDNSRVEALERRILALEKVNSPELADNSGILKLWGKPWSQGMTPGWVPADEWINKILRGSNNPGCNIGSDSVSITNDYLPTLSANTNVVQPYSGDYQVGGSVGGGSGKWWMNKIGVTFYGGGLPLPILPACRTVLFLKREGT